MTSEQVLEVIRTRRVIRHLTDEPVERTQLEKILEAGRWAPAGGNHRFVRFVAIENPATLQLIRKISPGMSQRPPAIILLCIDWNQVALAETPADDPVIYIDVGTAMENMLLATHALGLGAGPVTSFSKEAMRVVLNLPQHLTPEVAICIGHAAPRGQSPMIPKQRVTWQSLTDWERFED